MDVCQWVDLHQSWPLQSLCTCAGEVAPPSSSWDIQAPSVQQYFWDSQESPSPKSDDLKPSWTRAQSPNPWVQEAASIPLDSKIFPLLNTHILSLWFHLTLYVICTAPLLTLCVIKLFKWKSSLLLFIAKYLGLYWSLWSFLQSPWFWTVCSLMRIVMTKTKPKSNSK